MNLIYFVILALHIFIFGPSGSAQMPVQPGICKSIVKAAHQYHGILISHEDETGEYFYRDEKRCKLFTKAFLKKYNKGKGKNEKYSF